MADVVLAEAAPGVTPAASSVPTSDCQLHIELHDAAFWAEQLGKTQVWVLANHRINVFASQSPDEGEKVGEIRVGSRAVVLAEAENDFRVRSPLDDSVGWISHPQVARLLYLNVDTFAPCTP